MKKSLKLLAAAFASIMLLAAAATPVAMAASNTLPGSSISSIDRYILEQLPNSIPLANGNYFIPGFGEVSGDAVRELYKLYWSTIYPSYNPNYPTYPFYPMYPDAGVIFPSAGIQQITIEMNQFERKNIGLGTAYDYTSLTPDLVSVDEYGNVYALKEGEACVAVSKGGFTYILVKITVKGIDFDPDEYSIELYVYDKVMAVDDTTNVFARVLKNGYYASTSIQYLIE